SAAINVAENTTAVTTVTSTDVDAGDGKTYSITGGADSTLFAINAGTGALTFVSGRDFETPTDAGANNVYDVQVTVTDTAGLTDVQAIAVTVTDVNDNTPVITSNGGGASASINVAENTTAVTTVTATDADAGATLTYSITGGADQAKFTINPTTGVLAFVSAPDFETPTDSGANNVYDVTVQVSDGATTDTQDIAVSVTDIAGATIISNGGGATAAVSVAENATAVTTVIGTVDGAATLAYSIIGGADAAKFTINSTTGVLAFVAAPDFETPTDSGADNVYDVTVQVSDGSATDTQDIAVTITNVNEAPVITSNGGGASAAINVAENSTAVTTVTSTDVDAGDGKTYSITGGADSALFNINSSTGALTFVSGRYFETPSDTGANNVYDVQVTVTDTAGLTDVQAIAV
ncbi:MAG: cadherin domain-containing protein, partial [Pseudomonadota bacterium]|nr:cadherin domain-containing protein [Pseudomonadota bacterium]